jgi:uncharacterized protein YndB with AHSA1/START domain
VCKTVHDEITLNATPRQVYEAYMDSRAHATFTGEPARISRSVGGKFTAGGRYISGFNLDLVPAQRIVQAWRGSDWPKGAFSIVSLELRARGKGTRLVFDQRGIPDTVTAANSKEEWDQYYWEPLRQYFAPV